MRYTHTDVWRGDEMAGPRGLRTGLMKGRGHRVCRIGRYRERQLSVNFVLSVRRGGVGGGHVGNVIGLDG